MSILILLDILHTDSDIATISHLWIEQTLIVLNLYIVFTFYLFIFLLIYLTYSAHDSQSLLQWFDPAIFVPGPSRFVSWSQ